MVTDAVDLRLTFLKGAAHALAVPSPTISGALGAAHRNLLTVNDRDIEAPTKHWGVLQREMCGSCGNVLMPGWTDTISHQSGKHMIHTCMRCNRKTVQKLQQRPPRHTAVKSRPKPIEQPRDLKPRPQPAMNDDDSKVTKSASATSRQRKKARRGGLQAMLEKNKASKPSGGLDLMDFLS